MKFVNKVLIGLEGNPLKSGEVELTSAGVLVNCALMPAEGGRGYSAAVAASRYDAALTLNRLAVGESVDLTLELLASLKQDILRAYTPIVVGQMLPLLDGQH